jgi:hypothetical protein
MKKQLFLLAIAAVLALNAQSQSRSDKMYDALSCLDGVTNISFSKNMVDAVKLNVGENGEEQKVTGTLKQVKFMSYNPKKGNIPGHDFLKKAIGYLPKNNYKKYDEKGDKTENAEIWLLGGGKKYTECHIFIENDNSEGFRFVVSFYGDFRVEDIDGLKKAGKDFSND